MSGPEAALAIGRFVHDVAIMLLWGASAYLAAVAPPSLSGEIGRHWNSFRVAAVATAALTTAASLPIEAAAIGDGWAEAVDVATLGAVLLETSVGRAWQIQAAAAVLLVATLAHVDRRQVMTAGASGLLLITLALTGHAAMHEGWLGVAHRLNDTCHVLAGGAWLGALLPLLPTLSTLDHPGLHRDAGRALRRFSIAGHWAVGIVISTGVINTGLVLGRWPTDWSSPYRAMLAGKILLVLLMTMLALANRYVLVAGLAGDRERAIRRIRSATIGEVGLGIAVIGCVSVFGLLEPS